MAYMADFELPTHPDHFGAIVDNDPRIGVLMLEESDRALLDGPQPYKNAREVFAGLFPDAVKVRIDSVWELRASAH